VSPSASLIDRIESIPRRELYFFALYRLLMATVIGALLFSPLSGLVGTADHPRLATIVASGYLVVAVLVLLFGRNERWLRTIVVWSVQVEYAAGAGQERAGQKPPRYAQQPDAGRDGRQRAEQCE